MKNRRGRPPTNRPRFDVGTPELIAKRMAALGPQRYDAKGKPIPPDDTLSTTPLDVLKARGIISDEAHGAACYFAALRKMVFGKAHPGAIDLTAISGMPNEFDRADAESKYREACTWMKQQSRASLDAVENLVIHERWPRWMTVNGSKSGRDYQHFSLGIASLLGWYKGSQRRAA